MPQTNMPQQNLERFRELVLQDPALQEQLKAPGDRDSFVALVLQLGQARGFDFTVHDVTAALQANRRVWMERWIQ
ncbi:MAG: Nif11-like leader peptide family natural product precursor [Candidatus Sulfotelmatobacter sp.]